MNHVERFNDLRELSGVLSGCRIYAHMTASLHPKHRKPAVDDTLFLERIFSHAAEDICSASIYLRVKANSIQRWIHREAPSEVFTAWAESFKLFRWIFCQTSDNVGLVGLAVPDLM